MSRAARTSRAGYTTTPVALRIHHRPYRRATLQAYLARAGLDSAAESERLKRLDERTASAPWHPRHSFGRPGRTVPPARLPRGVGVPSRVVPLPLSTPGAKIPFARREFSHDLRKPYR